MDRVRFRNRFQTSGQSNQRCRYASFGKLQTWQDALPWPGYLGSAMVVNGIVEPMELGHLPYRKRTFEDYVGVAGRKRLGQKKWEQAVRDVVARLIAALEPGDVVLGGGNVNNLTRLPPGCRVGDNANAFVGGFRLWQKTKRH